MWSNTTFFFAVVFKGLRCKYRNLNGWKKKRNWLNSCHWSEKVLKVMNARWKAEEMETCFAVSHSLLFPILCTQTETRETLLGFNMVNYRACKNLWKACVEHHTFFRLEQPIPPQKNFFAHYFTLGSKFRYWWGTNTNTRTQSNNNISEKGCSPDIQTDPNICTYQAGACFVCSSPVEPLQG